MDATADVEWLVVVIKREFSSFPEQAEIDSIAKTPPAKVIDCVLSINRKYDGFVVPRVKEFIARHSDIIDLVGLKKLILSYPTLLDFLVQELNYNHKDRAEILYGVVEYLLAIQGHCVGKTESERLHEWAVKVQPRAYRDVNVKGFGLAGFQYLRILFGAQTTKPDIHIMNFITAAIGRKVDPEDAIVLIESAAKKMKISVRTIDAAIWIRMSSGSE
ncbi:MAG: hypothetical protein BWK76_27845 [Desulfobulbaceae bacterium A2]|nr:MAG: hypothetical protein BWK76_27845 [Desulfobulbaceae bacterium A2]